LIFAWMLTIQLNFPDPGKIIHDLCQECDIGWFDEHDLRVLPEGYRNDVV